MTITFKALGALLAYTTPELVQALAWDGPARQVGRRMRKRRVEPPVPGKAALAAA